MFATLPNEEYNTYVPWGMKGGCENNAKNSLRRRTHLKLSIRTVKKALKLKILILKP